MHRFIGTFLVALSMVTVAAAQNSATLAERMAALRQGWSTASDKTGEEAPPTPQAAKVAVATDSESRLPRIDPRDLLPKQWFGVAEVSDDKGSARARLLRDSRRSPTPRAGSAFTKNIPSQDSGASYSSNRSDSLRLTPSANAHSRSSRATAALARSIAADVADSLASDNTAVTESTDFEATETKIEDLDLSGVEPETDIEEVVVEIAPNKKDFVAAPQMEEVKETISPIEETVQGPNANATPRKPTARLPLYIGEQPGNESKSIFRSDSNDFTTSSVNREVSAAQKNTSDDDLLLMQRMPMIVSRVSGPRQIVVGREVTYRVTIANRGDATAEELMTNISIPEWAEVVGTQVSIGKVEALTSSLGDTGEYVWQMDQLESGSVAKFEVRLIARTGQPIELGITWKHRPIDSRTLIEVQEPKLSMSLTGPEEVLYGKPQLFRLTLSNPGTGVAENVEIRLTPPGNDGSRSQNHDFGELAAGESRTVEIELTAREAGDLAIEASATADGDLFTEATKGIFCRRPELMVDWRGPKHRYTGAAATYYLRVRNPGTAVASNIELHVDLPAGFKVIDAAGTPKPINGKITYRVGSLRPGDDRYFELKGVMNTAGDNTLTLQANASDDTQSEVVTAVTEVVALADLKLDILDPRGPIATGEEISYQIRITNRGSNEAHNVSATGLFSSGIEPHHVEGGVCTMSDGRVVFETIETIPAGAERVFTIHARAHEAGTHLFRAVVLCEDLEIKLSAEETTRFFEDETIDIARENSGYRY